MITVSGFGLSVVDILLRVDDVQIYQKNPADMQLLQLGGVVPTALTTLSRLGISTNLYTALGNDLFAGLLKTIFEKEHIQLTNVLSQANYPTPFSVVAIDKKTGERTGFNGQKQFFELDAASLKLPAEIISDAFLLDGHNPEASLHFLHLAQKKKIPTFLDLGNPKPGMAEIMKEADYLIIPQTYWREMWPDMTAQEVLKSYARLTHQTVILTIGAKGCWVGNQETEFYQPPFEAEVVDSNGAGDVFFGAFVYGIVQKWDLRKCIKFASAAGAFACEKYGKIEKIPNSVDSVNDILEKRVPVTM